MPRRPAIFVSGIAWLALLVTVVIVATRHESDGRRKAPMAQSAAHDSSDAQSNDGPQFTDVCTVKGKRISQEQLLDSLPHALFPSDSPTLGPLSYIELCGPEQAMLVYRSGVVINETVNPAANLAASWKSLASSDADEASLIDVHGATALLISPAADPSGQALGSVDFMRDDMIFYVFGNRALSAADLTSIARSLA